VAIIAGWWTAEVGRQPWVVYNVLLTKDGVSSTLSGEDVAISLGSFIGLYGLLFLLFIFLLNRKIQAGPEPLEAVETVAVSSLPDTFREVFRKRPHSAGPPPPDDEAVLVPAAAADGDPADGGPGGRPGGGLEDGGPVGRGPANGGPADTPAPAPREDES
jgi:hypothetical protein